MAYFKFEAGSLYGEQVHSGIVQAGSPLEAKMKIADALCIHIASLQADIEQVEFRDGICFFAPSDIEVCDRCSA